jgi:type I restriction enzyme S subunit
VSANLAIEAAFQNVPSTWRVHRFDRVLRRSELRKGHEDLQLLSLSSQGYLYERSGESDRQQASEENQVRCLRVEPGQLVVNPMWLTGGSVAVSRESGAVSPDYRVFAPTHLMDPRFLHFALRSTPYTDQYRLFVRAETTFDRRIQQEDLNQLPLHLPSLDEQRRIAEFLDDQVTRIASVIDLRREQAMALDEVAMHVLVEAARDLWPSSQGGPVSWFPFHRAGWQWLRVSWIATCLDGRRVPLSATERASRQGDYPYYGASTIVDFVDDYLFDEVLVLVGEDGGALTNPRFDVVQEVGGKIWVNNHAHVLRAVAVETRYLATVLRCVDRPLLLSGSTRPKITQNDLMSLRVPVPPTEDRILVLNRADAIREEIEVRRRVLDESVRLLDEYMQSLITAAVTGELDVTTARRGVT